MNEETKEVLSVMRDMFNSLDKKIDTMQNDVKEVKQQLVKMENESSRNFKLLVDGHIQNAEKLDKVDSMEKDLEIVKFDVDIIKKVVTTHSSQLNKLGKVE